MSYSVNIKQSALKTPKNIALENRLHIIQAIDRLKTSPEAGGVLKNEYSGTRCIRIGSYRFVYQVRDEQLTELVIRIGHRREVYR